MRSCFPPLRAIAGLAAAAGLTWLTAAPAVGAITVNLAEEDTIEVQVSGETAKLQINLTKSPPPAENLMLKAMIRDHSFWSVPVQRQGNRLTTELTADQVELMLIAERLMIEFPAGGEGEPLQLVIPRDRFSDSLEPVTSLLRGEPLFFTPPEQPAPLETPETSVERIRAESFAMQARQRERELTAYMHEYASARARAHALFLDLRTAGRLPWPEEQIQQFEASYEKLREREQAINQQREQLRSNAQQFIQQWNSAHSSEPPVPLSFGDAS